VKTNELIQVVKKENYEAEEEKKKVTIQEELTNEASLEAKKIANKTKNALAKALPVLEKAKAAVSCIKKENIGEMKNLKTPSPAVSFIMKVTLIMMGKYKSSMQDSKVWPAGIQMMKNPKQFLEQIKQYKGETIDENVKVMAKAEIKKGVHNICPFTEESHKSKGCLASSKLCLWIANILEYNETFLFVKPLRA
jgi:hypothetical protein